MAIYRSKMQYDPAVISDLEEFQYFVEKKLKGDLIDAIISNAEKGEIILHIGTPYSTHIPEMMLTEERLDMTMMDLVRCKDCKHRPERLEEGKGEGFNLEFPDDNFKCPCQCEDYWYSWMPEDDWFCKNGERKDDNNA